MKGETRTAFSKTCTGAYLVKKATIEEPLSAMHTAAQSSTGPDENVTMIAPPGEHLPQAVGLFPRGGGKEGVAGELDLTVRDHHR